MEEKTCEDCKHFIQHYAKARNCYRKIECGHCTYPRIKIRDYTCKACLNYQAHGAK